MTAEELLKTRFEVIAKYPFSNYEIGDILELKEKTTSKIFHNSEEFYVGNFLNQEELEKYPHLFRRLNWWEYRKQEDMPTKLICKAISDDTEVHDIEEWDMDILVGWTNKSKRECCSLKSFNPEYGYFPV